MTILYHRLPFYSTSYPHVIALFSGETVSILLDEGMAAGKTARFPAGMVGRLPREKERGDTPEGAA